MPSRRQVSPSPRHHRGRGVKISQWRWRPGQWLHNQGRMSHYNDCAKIRHNSPHCYREKADLLAHNQTFFSLSLSKIRSGTLAPSAITRGLSTKWSERINITFLRPVEIIVFSSVYCGLHMLPSGFCFECLSEFKDDWYENMLMLWLCINREARTDAR